MPIDNTAHLGVSSKLGTGPGQRIASSEVLPPLQCNAKPC